MLVLLVGLILATASARVIDLTVDGAHGVCRVRGEFVVHAPPETAWAVVSDYDHIPRFVHSMRKSHATRDTAGRILLRQEAVGGVFLVKRRVEVLLEVTEEPGRLVDFRDILGKDFTVYHGQWQIAPDSAGTRVRYQLDARPKTSLPQSLTCGVLKSTARDLLAEVRAEILRR